MAPSSSTSLQIPVMDSTPGSSRRQNPSAAIVQGSSTAPRPTSVAVHSTVNTAPATAPSRRQRASHNVVSSSNQQHPETPSGGDASMPYPDIFSHPAARDYIAAHPRRTIPRFGPYLLLQTLGEGEFGKVKLGLHVQWGEEVAVKLIRRGNLESTARMSKVEREIEVLRTLKHPHIVRLYDVIETDKYIGIILEFASGGELFDHILAHRYLRERDAAKLFSQLISGVWYTHQKKIVHRDLKLENLLLDRNRNVIITDFGFANRFENRADDLMSTSCGSPCYAAPELVISEGLYVGSAVDIWSCGVILYAMLAGYLPFDDDPANPDGDNINLLYRYIVSTPLSFPDYISPEARDLLSTMLVPDPTRRTTLDAVMRHPWLAAYHATRTDGQPNAFGKTVDDLERAALEQHTQRRLAYQRQMRSAAATNGTPANGTAGSSNPPSSSRTQSHRPNHSGASPVSGRSMSTQPELLYESSVDHSIAPPVTSHITATPIQNGSARSQPTSAALGLPEDDPFAGPPGSAPKAVTNGKTRTSEEGSAPSTSLSPPPAKGQKAPSGGGFRHTIQVEYDEPKPRRSEDKQRDRSGSQGQSVTQPPAQQISPAAAAAPAPAPAPAPVAAPATATAAAVPATPVKERRPSYSSTKPLPPNPGQAVPSSYRAPKEPVTPKPTASQTVTPSTTPPKANGDTVPVASTESIPEAEKDKETGSQTSGGSSARRGHKKGKSSIDKLGLSKIFGSALGGSSSHQPPTPSPAVVNGEVATAQPGSITPSASEGKGSASSVLLSPVEKEPGKKTRRNTLTVMVEPISRSIRNRKAGRASTPLTSEPPASATNGAVKTSSPQPQTVTLPPSTSGAPPSAVDSAAFPPSSTTTEYDGNGMPASTSKAKKVMQWFRTKSKGRDSLMGAGEDEEIIQEKESTPTQGKYRKPFSASSTNVSQQISPPPSAGTKDAPVQVVLTTPGAATARPVPSPLPTTGHPQRSASSHTESSAVSPSFVSRFRNSVTVGGGSQSAVDRSHPYGQLRLHHGAVDQTTVTTRPPPEVMAHVHKVLEGMGVEIQKDSDYKYRCIRVKRKKGAINLASTSPVSPSGSASTAPLAAVSMVGSAASNGVDKRGLPLPSPSAFAGTGGMLRGLLMRRQSSQVSSHSMGASGSVAFDDETSIVVDEPVSSTATYGDPSQDAGDEVRFSVELTRIDRLNDTYSLDIRRLKGNLRSYKYLYDTVRGRANLSNIPA